MNIVAKQIKTLIPNQFSDYVKYAYRKIRSRLKQDSNEIVREMGNYYLPKNYLSRKNPGFDVHGDISHTGILWQPDVYMLARQMAMTLGVDYIIDVGCGHGEKIANFYPDFNVIGYDTDENISWCQDNYDFGDWIGMNFDSEKLELPDYASKNSLLICSDVIEHIVDADLFTDSMIELLGQCQLGIISTPDRSKIYPVKHSGPPLNHNHVREWAPEELRRYFESKGINTWVGLTRTNTSSEDMHTIIAIVSIHRK